MKHEIEIEGLPEGWKAVAFRVPKDGESIIDFSGDLRTVAGHYNHPRLIVEKIPPRRIVLEETEEDQPDNESQWLLEYRIGMFYQDKKWRVVEEE